MNEKNEINNDINKTNTSSIDEKVERLDDDDEEEEDNNDTGFKFNELTGITEIESLCMNCQKNGITKLIMKEIPYFREIVIMSFDCDECGFRNNEVQFGGELQEKGCEYVLKVQNRSDLDRQIIKSDFATVKLPDLDFEIPAKTQRGGINTIEGLLKTAINNLKFDQEQRYELDPEIAQKIDDFIAKLVLIATGIELPFTIIINDPSGNSFIENPFAPENDPNLNITYYDRTPTQDYSIGLQPTEEAKKEGTIDDQNPKHQNKKAHFDSGLDQIIKNAQNENIDEKENNNNQNISDLGIGRKEIISLPAPCPHCFVEGESLMCLTDIPYFKEIIIMSFNCNECGFKSNEIKGGGAIPQKGQIMTLTVDNVNDMGRDLLKSDTAGIFISELDLELSSGSLGGMYTTVEGILKKLRDVLVEGNPFFVGDSAILQHGTPEEIEKRNKFNEFMEKLDEYVAGNIYPFTLILKDPLANSFIASRSGEVIAPEDDPLLIIEEYERSQDEDDMLGISDMITEDYEINDENKNDEEHKGKRGDFAPSQSNFHVRGPDHPTQYTQGS